MNYCFVCLLINAPKNYAIVHKKEALSSGIKITLMFRMLQLWSFAHYLEGVRCGLHIGQMIDSGSTL